nr:MAG TPA: Major capsid protein [Microviridae sp.]
MANAFTSVPETKNNPNKNVWDWSHINNVTTEIGRLTPVFCRRVPAGTSMRIEPDFAMKFMPMMFPVQSAIKARINFFRMPIRALWRNYKDWLSTVNMKDADGNNINSQYVPPYISISTDETTELYERFSDFFGTCSDADLMGLPTTLDTAGSGYWPYELIRPNVVYGTPYAGDSRQLPAINTPFTFDAEMEQVPFKSSTARYVAKLTTAVKPADIPDFTFRIDNIAREWFRLLYASLPLNTDSECLLAIGLDSNKNVVGYWRSNGYDAAKGLLSFSLFASQPYNIDSLYLFLDSTVSTVDGAVQPRTLVDSFLAIMNPDLVDFTPATCPWYNRQTQTGLKVSSLPFRMREAVYNAYIRNDRNNPLVVDGVPKYNDWVLCYDKDGDDSRNYGLIGGSDTAPKIQGERSGLDYFFGRKYVNWEPDYLTTAVQSPQEGDAPLVGLTNYATVVQEDNGAAKMKLNSVLTDEDGNHYQIHMLSDKEGLKGVNYTQLDVKDIEGNPVTNMYQAVSSGISIEDFRQVNAYQRYLELNMRRGYSYKDIVEGRYDVKVRYDDLLMPEFCGGFTRDVGMNAVTQTTPTDESGTYQGALGSQAGDGFVVGSSEAPVNIYCDEESIVMAFISIAPTPIYSQTLLKDWLISDPLDEFTPEFANIGFQPITLAEVAPIQAFNNGGAEMLTKIFGYQRPWYHLIGMTDQAHGLFRTQLKNFIMKRTWQGVPELGRDFLLVKPEQVNDVFSVIETTDKIFGQILFKIKVKNEVPRNAVPRLE